MVGDPNATKRDQSDDAEHDAGPRAALVMVFADGPAYRAFSIAKDGLELGREGRDVVLRDDLASRAHVRIGTDDGSLVVDDLNSSNGTYVDGLRSVVWRGQRAVVRVGGTLFVADHDGNRFFGATVKVNDGVVIGPTLGRSLAEISAIAQDRDTVCIRGESGVGKELAARRFHDHSARREGPFVAVNCATIPEAIAERLLFGAVKGAYSGAEAAQGYVSAAHNGTLFLDEISELSLGVQAKLLRVLETRQSMALGATAAREIVINVCCAGHADLREAVASGRFRDDLYYRIGRPLVELPALRERPEDIPSLIAGVVKELPKIAGVHAQLVETCLVRPWPGNVRELATEIREAGRRAVSAGRNQITKVDLAADAGLPLASAQALPRAEPGDAADRAGNQSQPDQAAVVAALQSSRGNVAAAARALGCHRNQLRRWLVGYGLDPKQFARG